MEEIHLEGARLVVVPVARPDTAQHMLEIATSLIDREEGQVVALMVALGDTEKASRTSDALTPVIESFQREGYHVELVTEIATSVSRGILDAARERGADMIVLGVEKSDHHEVRLGKIVENVLQAAHCDVLIYRLSDSPAFDRIVVPIDGSQQAAVALHTGVMLSRQTGMTICPLYIQQHYHFSPENELRMRAELLEIEGQSTVQRGLIGQHDAAAQILERVGEDDLLILGFEHRDDLAWQLADNFTGRLLNHAPGPVVITSRLKWQGSSVRQKFYRYLMRMNPTLTTVEQNEIVWQAQKMSDANIDYLVMIVFSAGLASLGLLLNSTAVVIGAMLVAPLMQPLAGFSVGLGMGLLTLTRRASVTLVQGALLGILIAIIIGLLPLVDQPTSEMLARGQPTLLDAGVALVSGLVAAYATARKGIPVALAGVAIAAALMPPLCTVGLAIAHREPDLAFGAFLLFLTNIVFIIAAEYGVFLWLGMRPGRYLQAAQQYGLRLWGALLSVLIVIVSALLLNLSSAALATQAIRGRLAELMAPAQLVQTDITSVQPLQAVALVRSDVLLSPRFVEGVRATMEQELGYPVELEVVVLRALRPSNSKLMVENYMAEAFPDAELVEISLSGDGPLVALVTLRMTQDPQPEQIMAAQAELAEVLGQPVQLELVVQRVLRGSVLPLPLPEDGEE